MAFLMALFPKILPREAERRKNTGVTEKSNKTKSFKGKNEISFQSEIETVSIKIKMVLSIKAWCGVCGHYSYFLKQKVLKIKV